jgi:ribosomal-protein-serine acetyltransferase
MRPNETLTDGNIAIRPFEPEDAPAVHEAVQESLAEVDPWLPDLTSSLTVEGIKGWIEMHPGQRAEGSAYHFAIVDAGNSSILGGCGLTHLGRQHRYANLYYWVRTGSTGQGVATVATRLLSRFGFERLGLQRVEIIMSVDNAASARVAEKAGALYEGTLRNRLNLHGAAHDGKLYSLVPSDLDMDL